MSTDAPDLERLARLEQVALLAFRTAHLLTASFDKAEAAVLKSIDSFDPERDTEDALFTNAIRAAIQSPSGPPQITEYFEPELQTVIRLPENVRGCLVLHVPGGSSPPRWRK